MTVLTPEVIDILMNLSCPAEEKTALMKALVRAGQAFQAPTATNGTTEERVRLRNGLVDDAHMRRLSAERARRRRAMMPSLAEWEALRADVFARDAYRCTYCGVETDDPHCDHVVPLSRGGSNHVANLATARAACNISKGAKTLEEWRGGR